MKKIYDLSNLGEMLTEMGSYLNENPQQGYENEFEGVFTFLTCTGLFHDACGKEIDRVGNKVVVTTDY